MHPVGCREPESDMCTMFTVCSGNLAPAMVMEYLPNGDLKSFLSVSSIQGRRHRSGIQNE